MLQNAAEARKLHSIQWKTARARRELVTAAETTSRVAMALPASDIRYIGCYSMWLDPVDRHPAAMASPKLV